MPQRVESRRAQLAGCGGARTRPGLQGDVFRFTLGLVYSIFD